MRQGFYRQTATEGVEKLNNYAPRPRGRPPRCYKLAHKYVGCLECAWYSHCNPKPVPIQAVVKDDPDPAECFDPRMEDKEPD